MYRRPQRYRDKGRTEPKGCPWETVPDAEAEGRANEEGSMNRISERIGAVLGTVTCPGCGKSVAPTVATGAPESAHAGDAKRGRWSFVWRPPSGRVCPECSFPLERHARRVPWIRLFGASVALLTVTFLIYVTGRFVSLPSWSTAALRVMLAVGVIGLLVGLSGLIVGGRGPVGD